MGKYRQDERILYNLEKSYDYLGEVTEEYKKGYLSAIDHVKNQVERNTKYYESKGDKE